MPAPTSAKTFDCEICGAALRSQRSLVTHLCLVHDECDAARLGTPITFRCATCGESFARRGELLAHLDRSGHGPSAATSRMRSQNAQRRGRARPRNG